MDIYFISTLHDGKFELETKKKKQIHHEIEIYIPKVTLECAREKKRRRRRKSAPSFVINRVRYFPKAYFKMITSLLYIYIVNLRKKIVDFIQLS